MLTIAPIPQGPYPALHPRAQQAMQALDATQQSQIHHFLDEVLAKVGVHGAANHDAIAQVVDAQIAAAGATLHRQQRQRRDVQAQDAPLGDLSREVGSGTWVPSSAWIPGLRGPGKQQQQQQQQKRAEATAEQRQTGQILDVADQRQAADQRQTNRVQDTADTAQAMHAAEQQQAANAADQQQAAAAADQAQIANTPELQSRERTVDVTRGMQATRQGAQVADAQQQGGSLELADLQGRDQRAQEASEGQAMQDAREGREMQDGHGSREMQDAGDGREARGAGAASMLARDAAQGAREGGEMLEAAGDQQAAGSQQAAESQQAADTQQTAKGQQAAEAMAQAQQAATANAAAQAQQSSGRRVQQRSVEMPAQREQVGAQEQAGAQEVGWANAVWNFGS